MEVANQVLNAIAANIRDVVRLMTDTSNADACMMKVDRCLTRLHSLRGVVDDARIASVEVTLGSLRSQLMSERSDCMSEAGGQSSVERNYCAERLLSGKYYPALRTPPSS